MSTPRKLGFSANDYEVGKYKYGSDDNLYVVIETKKTKRWKKTTFDLDKLGSEYFRDAYFPKYTKIESETGLENKIGGKVPFFIEGEKWPIYEDEKMIFLGQFTDPRDSSEIKTLFRVFLSTIDEFHSCVTHIKLNKENLAKQIKIDVDIKNNSKNENGFEIYDAYEVVSWVKEKELISFEEILKLLKIDEDCENDKNKFYEKYYDDYHDHDNHPDPGIKIGGTSVFCQYHTDMSLFNNFFQMSECTELPYEWGDSGIAHIFKNDRSDKYYLYFDCY